MRRTIEWRLTEAQKDLILRAIVNCPTDVGAGDEELAKHRAQCRVVDSELEGLGWGDSLWEYLFHDTRRRTRSLRVRTR